MGGFGDGKRYGSKDTTSSYKRLDFAFCSVRAGGAATSSHKGTPIYQADLRRPVAVLVGNEGSGLPKVFCPRRMKSWLFHSRRALSHSTQASPHRSFFTKPPGKGIIHQTDTQV